MKQTPWWPGPYHCHSPFTRSTSVGWLSFMCPGTWQGQVSILEFSEGPEGSKGHTLGAASDSPLPPGSPPPWECPPPTEASPPSIINAKQGSAMTPHCPRYEISFLRLCFSPERAGVCSGSGHRSRFLLEQSISGTAFLLGSLLVCAHPEPPCENVLSPSNCTLFF